MKLEFIHGWRIFGRRGLTLIEELVTLIILLIVIFAVYHVFLGGTLASSSASARLEALQCAEMEIQRIAAADYDSLPPEQHTLQKRVAQDGSVDCRIKLGHMPLARTVKVFAEDGQPLRENFSVLVQDREVIFAPDLSGKKVIVQYTYGYPRHKLVLVPKSPPHRTKLTSCELREVIRVVDAQNRPIPVSVDKAGGFLTFQPQHAGNRLSIEYRSSEDEGVVEGAFLSTDLASVSSKDNGFKLIRLVEAWDCEGKRKEITLSYVRTR